MYYLQHPLAFYLVIGSIILCAGAYLAITGEPSDNDENPPKNDPDWSRHKDKS